MDSPATRFDQPVPQRPLRAWLFSSEAVHDEIPLDAYLRYCLRVLVAKYRKSFHPLPEVISIDQGRIVCTPNPDSKRYWADLRDDAGERGVQYMSPEQQEEIARESGRIEAEAQDVEARSRALREAIEEHEMRAAEARSTGTEPGPRTLQYARPRCPKRLGFPWLLSLRYGAIGFLGLVEAFQLTWPILDRMAVDTANLAMEWQRAPMTVMGGIASAIAATACLIFAWHLLVSSAVKFSMEWETAGPLRSGVKLVGLVVLTVFLFLFTLCIGNLRHDTAVSGSGFQGAALGQSSSNADTHLFFS